MTRPRLLDLFCGAGGAAMGYHRAGFEVVGVDIDPQPRYPFTFVQADATTYPLDGFDGVHSSPPCDDHTSVKTTGPEHGNAWMLPHTIDRLAASGLPYVVENVPGAMRKMPGAYRFCGKAFGLAPLKRHRFFLTSFPMLVPPCVCHRKQVTIGVYGELTQKDRATSRAVGRKPGIRASVHTARQLMGCPWMEPGELSKAIPPAYTEFIGEHMFASLAVAS